MDVDVNLEITAPLIEECRTFNPGLAVLMVQNSCSTTSQLERRELANAFMGMESVFRLTSTWICDRKVYRTTIADGLGPYEGTDVKAKSEIENLFNEMQREL